jgi:hypothetical protein
VRADEFKGRYLGLLPPTRFNRVSKKIIPPSTQAEATRPSSPFELTATVTSQAKVVFRATPEFDALCISTCRRRLSELRGRVGVAATSDNL